MILDTNALTGIADNEAAAARIATQAESIELPVIVLGEYRFGIAQSRRRAEYEKWLGGLVAATRVLPVDDETASQYAQIRAELKKAGTPIPTNDVWIAALCRQYRMPVMSQDRHFDAVEDLKRIGW